MRLLFRAALLVAAISLAPVALHAQASLGIAGGLALPTGDASNDVKSGYNVTVALGIKPPVAPIGLRIDAMLNSMDSKAAGGNALRILGGNANITLSAPMLPMGYAIAGVGMYNSSVSGSTTSETDVGFNGGLGINFPLTGISTFLEARYHHVPSEGGSFAFVPVTFGIRF